MTTSRELPNPDNPAVNAKGTVNPSDNPTILRIRSTPAIERWYCEDLHIPHDLRRDKIPLVFAFQILATLPLSLVDRTLRVERISRQEQLIQRLGSSRGDLLYVVGNLPDWLGS